MITELGKLERIRVRDVWKNEALDFTPWLADNLELLSEALSMDITLEECEQLVGNYRADIVARDMSTQQLVLIENQLERADHSHLGQLITYASGIEATTLVWIAESFEDEHLRAVQWINEMTPKSQKIFAVEIALWKIGDSPLAPTLSIVGIPSKVRIARSEAPPKLRLAKEKSPIANEEEILAAYPRIQRDWIDKDKKTATLEEVSSVTGHSKQKLRGARIQRDNRNQTLFRVTAVIEWLKTAPYPGTRIILSEQKVSSYSSDPSEGEEEQNIDVELEA